MTRRSFFVNTHVPYRVLSAGVCHSKNDLRVVFLLASPEKRPAGLFLCRPFQNRPSAGWSFNKRTAGRFLCRTATESLSHSGCLKKPPRVVFFLDDAFKKRPAGRFFFVNTHVLYRVVSAISPWISQFSGFLCQIQRYKKQYEASHSVAKHGFRPVGGSLRAL